MDEILDFAVLCAREAGEIQRRYLSRDFRVIHKGEINLLTEVDLACEERIVSLIERYFPGDDILSEERAATERGSPNRWIVDPLDGTTNYAHRYPFFSTSIAYERSGEIVVGVVYSPVLDELFFAQKEKGAYMNGERIRVSKVAKITDALLSTGFPYDLKINSENNIDHFVKCLLRAQAVRRDGSAALNLAYVACGRFDAHWELRLNPWDMAAGYLLVLEAGGMVTTMGGEEFTVYKNSILATNGLIHEEMIELLQGRNGKV